MELLDFVMPVIAYALGAVALAVSIVSLALHGKDKWPCWGIFLGGLLIWYASYQLQGKLADPLPVGNYAILHIGVPIALSFAAILFVICIYDALTTKYVVSFYTKAGSSGHGAAAPSYTAVQAAARAAASHALPADQAGANHVVAAIDGLASGHPDFAAVQAAARAAASHALPADQAGANLVVAAVDALATAGGTTSGIAAERQPLQAALYIGMFLIALTAAWQSGKESITSAMADIASWRATASVSTAVDQVVKLGKEIDKKQPGKPLAAQGSPFRVTLYPDQFDSKYEDAMKTLLVSKAKKRYNISKIISIKYQLEADKSLTALYYYKAEDSATPPASYRATTRATVDIGSSGDFETWLKDHVLSHVQMLHDSKMATGQSAPAATSVKTVSAPNLIQIPVVSFDTIEVDD